MAAIFIFRMIFSRRFMPHLLLLLVYLVEASVLSKIRYRDTRHIAISPRYCFADTSRITVMQFDIDIIRCFRYFLSSRAEYFCLIFIIIRLMPTFTIWYAKDTADTRYYERFIVLLRRFSGFSLVDEYSVLKMMPASQCSCWPPAAAITPKYFGLEQSFSFTNSFVLAASFGAAAAYLLDDMILIFDESISVSAPDDIAVNALPASLLPAPACIISANKLYIRLTSLAYHDDEFHFTLQGPGHGIKILSLFPSRKVTQWRSDKPRAVSHT